MRACEAEWKSRAGSWTAKIVVVAAPRGRRTSIDVENLMIEFSVMQSEIRAKMSQVVFARK